MQEAARRLFAHSTLEALPSLANDCSSFKLLKKSKHPSPATETAINLSETIFKSS